MKHNPFIAPEGFFPSNKEQILLKVKQQRNKRCKLIIALSAITAAATIAIFLICHNTPKTNINFNSINFADITTTEINYTDDIFFEIL